MHFSMAPIMREKSRKMAWLPESFPICAAIGGFPRITCMGWRQNWTKLKRIPCACILIMSAAHPWFPRKRIKPQEKPTKLMFLNVGKDENWNVFVGSHLNRGDHWTICHVDSIDLRGFYGMGAATSSRWDWWRLLESTHLWGEDLPYTQWFAVIIPSTVPAWPCLWSVLYYTISTAIIWKCMWSCCCDPSCHCMFLHSPTRASNLLELTNWLLVSSTRAHGLDCHEWNIAQNSATHPGPLLDASTKFESQLGKARVKQ